ncbi:hypothetical protein LguiB_028116 [Lonicera macranthoides]
MYSWEKSQREDRSRKNSKNPSFSSILLNEIYRSIDGGEEKIGEFKARKERTTKNQRNSVSSRVKSSSIEDEEMANFCRVSLIEKWMEKKAMVSSQRGFSFPELDKKSVNDNNDALFSNSGSSCSDSSFGGFSSSETESFGAVKSRISYFAAPESKYVKTSVSAESRRSGNSVACQQQSKFKFYLFDDEGHETNKAQQILVKSRTKVMKIYDNLKNMKQPISPGGQISNFFTSIFTNGNAKKIKNSKNINEGFDKGGVERKEGKSTCSSAPSFMRSCFNKNPPKSTEKLKNSIKRTVRFYEQSSRQGNDDEQNSCSFKKNHMATRDSKGHNSLKKRDCIAKSIRYEENDHDDNAASDSSSNLFELDHLAFFKDDRIYKELPVYETTFVHRNRAIASGLIL